MKLQCQQYNIDCDCTAALPVIHARFVLPVRTTHTEEVADALRKVALLLGGAGIDLVFSDPEKPRCMHCGSLNNVGENHCTQCGAPL